MRKKLQKVRIKCWQLVIICLVIVFGVFIIFVVAGITNMDAEIIAVTDYALPTADSLDDLYSMATGDWSLAVDGNVVAGKNINDREIRATASTAKMILGLAVMQAKPFDLGSSGETITITRENYDRYIWYINNGGSNTRVRVGEEISEYDALASVFLASSNNMADTMAVWAFGSLDGYKEYATKMLNEWGITDTTIGVDASGFSESTTSTTEDLAKIGAKVLENPVLAEIVGRAQYEVPVAGVIENTNKLLGQNGVIGVKTGFIGEPSGYCLVSGYRQGEHIITLALLGADTRQSSFNQSKEIITNAQEKLKEKVLIESGQVIGKYESWWDGEVAIRATEKLSELVWNGAETDIKLNMNGGDGILKVNIAEDIYEIPVRADEYRDVPSFWEKFLHLFGWKRENVIVENDFETEEVAEIMEVENELESAEAFSAITNAATNNCTKKYGYLMLINPNFTVDTNFIAERKAELISMSQTYGIPELKASNGDNLMDAEAAMHLNDMVKAYQAEYPGHIMGTRSCFRAVGTKCGRLCAATGTSDHHTGLTCDLIDQAYGSALDTDYYASHPEWQWLKANSYKYGFIDRFPEAWAGGSMSEPLNVDENGTTGLFETWHYRYVGVEAATEIAEGKYNHGEYDSLEHYLKARGLVTNLKNAICK